MLKIAVTEILTLICISAEREKPGRGPSSEFTRQLAGTIYGGHAGGTDG